MVTCQTLVSVYNAGQTIRTFQKTPYVEAKMVRTMVSTGRAAEPARRHQLREVAENTVATTPISITDTTEFCTEQNADNELQRAEREPEEISPKDISFLFLLWLSIRALCWFAMDVIKDAPGKFLRWRTRQ